MSLTQALAGTQIGDLAMYVHLLVDLHINKYRRAMMIIRTVYAGNYRLRPTTVFEVNKWLRLSSFTFLDTYFQCPHVDLANVYKKRIGITPHL